MRKKILALSILTSLALPAQALGLLDGYRMALEHDPMLRAARAGMQEGEASVGVSRAALLPNVSAYVGRSKITGNQEAPNILGTTSTTPLDYRSDSKQIQLRQTLFNAYRYLDYRQSRLRSDQTVTDYQLESNKLIGRYLSAYMDVYLQQQNLKIAEALITSLGEVVKLAQGQYKQGEGTIIDLMDAEARLSVAEARKIEAEGMLRDAEQNLALMIGSPVVGTATIQREINRNLQPQGTVEQIVSGVQGSVELRKSQQTVDITKVELQKARSNHLPTLDLVASKSYSLSESISTRDQTTRQNVIGLQLNIPLFSGGQTYYQGEAMRARLERAEAERDNMEQQVKMALAKNYHGLKTGLQKIEGYVRSVQAGEKKVLANKKGISVGVKTLADLLDAEEQLSISRRDLVDAQSQVVNSWVQLKSLQGDLEGEDVAWLDKWFVSGKN